MEIIFFSLKNISVKNEACLPITSGDCNQWVIKLFTISKETKFLREVNGTLEVSYFLGWISLFAWYEVFAGSIVFFIKQKVLPRKCL